MFFADLQPKSLEGFLCFKGLCVYRGLTKHLLLTKATPEMIRELLDLAQMRQKCNHEIDNSFYMQKIWSNLAKLF